MIWYFLIQNTIDAISRKYQNISFFSPSFIGFRPFQTHCTIFCSCLPIEMTWNRVFLSETGEKSRLCFGKTIWNWVFLSETGGKLRLCFGKTIWNRVFLSETSEKLRFNYLRIMSICRYETVTIQKILIYECFHSNFHKKGSRYQI